ncbi:MAG: hypothetical protein U0T31_05750 [Chitinophagales bacterium]
MRSVFCVFIFCFTYYSVISSEAANLIYNSDNNNSNVENLQRLFPKDTVSIFIKNYTTDSLKRLIVNRIHLAESFINIYTYDLSDDLLPIEIKLVAEHFGLNIPLHQMPKRSSFLNFYHLYGKFYGKDSAKIGKIIKNAINHKINITDSIRNKIRNNYTQLTIAGFCNKISIDNDIYDSIYNEFKLQEIDDKLHTYWLFSEINRNSMDTINVSLKYQKFMFDSLYKHNNLADFYKEAQTLNKKTLVQNDSEYYSNITYFKHHFNPNRLLAYALYGNDINLESYSENLMYLLDAQQTDGSWAMSKIFNYRDKDLTASFYGMWALCEYWLKLSMSKK